MNCLMNKIRIMAHRGASYHAPENTRLAFLKAYDFGADGIETDLQLTGDGEAVVHHNYYIDSTSNGKGAILNMTVEELKTYDFGAYKGREFAGEKILTLEELLPLLENMRVINLELKSPVDKSVDFVGKILDIVGKSQVADRVLYSSFDAGLLQQVKERDKESRVGLLAVQEKMQQFIRESTAVFAAAYPVKNPERLLREANRAQTLTELVDGLEFHPDYLHPDYHSVLENPGLVAQMHERGIGVNPYTCDTAEEIRRLIEAGCDGIITNRPDIAAAVAQNAG